MRDWLYGITQTRPPGNKDTIVAAWYEAEDLLSMDHLVNWPQSMGGAGITPGLGEWKNVKAIFPMHNDKVNQALLRSFSKKLLLGTEDLDQIRDLFGSKVWRNSNKQFMHKLLMAWIDVRLPSTLHLDSPIRPFFSSQQLLASFLGYGYQNTPSSIPY